MGDYTVKMVDGDQCLFNNLVFPNYCLKKYTFLSSL